MRKLFIAAASYLAVGLISGVFYREFTRAYAYVGDTQLSRIHTHTLVLGTLFFMILIGLNKLFDLSEDKRFNMWFILYNVGLAWTTAAMFTQGVVNIVYGPEEWIPAFSGIAGFGHIILAFGLIRLFQILYTAIRGDSTNADSVLYR
ncbi:DUF2871 domain-containing protein [Arcanobacterium haemolyticum]|uniref:DUF2871 domain-containing protein n=2 Tax=Arcanobacterium haemolyticum TaxID=28264 RepID=D7BMM8_ARCHD|nr:DUF2871 domain-containing protein [Arcanobacterium haemolyticum]ADH92177.1 conserved hypothetical protein [Arcanobacterium haemolyticum DSM 20595]QCX46336.1 DUF2871 domain-containing protein [Arcanobacterium haemolyticum]SQH29118.1 Protein of uncharacterised function (DUF2871) [Arcanobacterium haemolyticum]